MCLGDVVQVVTILSLTPRFSQVPAARQTAEAVAGGLR